MGFLEKLTTRNILALTTTSLIVATIGKFLTDPADLIVTIQDNQEYVIGGSVVFGMVLAKWSDVMQFFFRKPQEKESKP